MEGFFHHKAYLTKRQQKGLLDEVLKIINTAPFYTPTMPKTGRPFSVLQTNCGSLGWVSDKNGYRYQSTHPITNMPWPPLPKSMLDLWQQLTALETPPEACLINHYKKTAKMGLHQDKDEQDLKAPVVSISLGNSAKFRLGGQNRRDKTHNIDLKSGDVIILGGAARRAYHGIDRIINGSSTLLSDHKKLDGGRLNITLRRVTKLEFEIN